MSEVVILLPNTERLQLLKIMSEVVILLPITERLQQVEDCVRGVIILPTTECLQQDEDYIRDCTTSTKYWMPSTRWRLCQRLYYFYHILNAFNKLKIMSVVEFPHDNWKNDKTIYRLYIFYKEDSRLECFIRATKILTRETCFNRATKNS
jgi:hypothetical protein